MSKVVRNKSTGYGYKYSSLADLADAGVNIPKMRVKPTEFGEYVEYFDGQEWQLGAKVVVISSKTMNDAQAYGASLTYARRYTVMMAEQVACDDDDAVEKAKPKLQNKNIAEPVAKQPSASYKIDFNEIRLRVQEIGTVTGLESYRRSLGEMSDGQAKIVLNILKKRKEELNGME